MIKVGFGVTQLARGLKNSSLDGIGHYTKEIVHAVLESPKVDLYPFSFGREFQSKIAGKDVAVLNRFDFDVLKGLLLPPLRLSDINGEKVDIIHASDHLVPYVNNVPIVATLMDAIPLSNPEMLSNKLFSLTKIKLLLWRSLSRRADHIITISEYSKTEISKWFDIPLDKISVIPLAVDSRFFNEILPEERIRIRKSFNIPENFFLSVGTLQPRKNIKRILAAMRLLPNSVKKCYPLVIVGRDGWGVESFQDEIEQAEKEGWCIRLNRVSDIELRALLQSACALVFPSLLEGFGLPVLEAFASRTPVITSNTTSLPEASNGAALLVDPNSEYEISSAMLRVLNETDLIKSNVEKGYKHAKSMTWHRCAQETIAVYQQLVRK